MNPSFTLISFKKVSIVYFCHSLFIEILYAFKSGSPWGYIYIYIYVSLLILSRSDLFRVVLLRFLYALIPCTKYNYNLDLFPVHNIKHYPLPTWIFMVK